MNARHFKIDNNIIDVKDVRLSNKIVNVSEYGAKGDGVTDDSDAIQLAINNGGDNSIIIFEPLTYIISKPIVITNSYVKLMCLTDHQRQFGQACIKANYLYNDIVSIGNGTNWVENVTIENIRISRTVFGDSTSKGFHVYNNTLFTSFLNCGASGSRYGYYQNEGASGMRINHCHITPHIDTNALNVSFDVAGIRFEGGTTGGSGLFVYDVIYYGNENDTTTTRAIYCSSNGQFGDMWIEMVQCAGKISEVIKMVGGGGFNQDVNIYNITADYVTGTGIHLQSGQKTFNNINVSMVWFLLYGDAKGIACWTNSGLNINQIKLNSDSNFTGDFLFFDNVEDSNITDVVINGTSATRVMQCKSCGYMTFKGIIAHTSNDIHIWVDTPTGNIMLDNILLPNGNIQATSSYVHILNCITRSTSWADNVRITPNKINSSAGQTIQFHAYIDGIQNDTGVYWDIGGSRSASTNITTSGLLTIGGDENVNTMFVMAKSRVNQYAHDISVIEIY